MRDITQGTAESGPMESSPEKRDYKGFVPSLGKPVLNQAMGPEQDDRFHRSRKGLQEIAQGKRGSPEDGIVVTDIEYFQFPVVHGSASFKKDSASFRNRDNDSSIYLVSIS